MKNGNTVLFIFNFSLNGYVPQVVRSPCQVVITTNGDHKAN